MKSFKSFFATKTLDELLLAALVFLLPFERIPSLDILGVSIRLSFIPAAILIVRALQALIRDKFKSLRRDLSVKLLLAFMLWVTITALVAINVPRAGMVVIFTLFTAIMALAIRVLYKPQYLKLIIKALLWSASIVAFFGLYQYFGNMVGLPAWATGIRSQYSWQIFGFPRIHSTALEPLYYCSYLLIPISYLIIRILDERPLHKQHVALFVLLAGSVVMTLSRGGIVALFALVITAGGLMIIQSRTNVKSVAQLIGLIILSAGAALLIISIVSRAPLNKKITGGQEGAAGYTNQLKKTSLDGSGDDRGVMRDAALDLIIEDGTRSVIGIGPGQFGPYYQHNKAATDGGWKIVNNETLELFVEYGLIGFLLFVSFMISVLLKAWRSTRDNLELSGTITLALISYVVATAVQYQTFSTLYIMHIWVVVGLLMALGSRKNSNA